MDVEAKKRLVHRILERVAEQVGDITAPAMALFYKNHPDARERFVFHDPRNPARMEGSMVEQALYCLMRWHECPGEIEIILVTTVPQHIETMGVGTELFCGLLDAVCAIVAETIPAAELDEHAIWQNLQQTLLGIIAEAASHASPRDVSIAA